MKFNCKSISESNLFSSYLKFLIAFLLSLSTAGSAYAQDKDWAPLDGDLLTIFTSPWLKADLDKSVVGQNGLQKKVPPLATVNFEECSQSLFFREGQYSGMAGFDILNSDKRADFQELVPLSMNAKADFHIMKDGADLIAFTENRFRGAPPDARLFSTAVGRPLPNGVIMIIVQGSRAYEQVEGQYQLVRGENFTEYMAVRRAREVNGEDYFQLISPISPDGDMTSDTTIYYSCLKAQ